MRVNILLSVMLCVFYSALSHAEHDVSDLGKLFTDKGQRSQIDAARTGSYVRGTETKHSRKVNMSGYMTRSSGKNVVWANNKNTLNGHMIGDIKVQKSKIGENKKVGVTVDGAHVHLKPGETWNTGTGKIVEHD